MKTKTVIPREQAAHDIDQALDYYLEAAGDVVASAFVDALEQALNHVARHPASGSLRYAHELDLPELRFWRVRDYPYLLFYVEREDHIDLWRVLHGERDLPVWMRA
nr:type II toxin-antitoxin system RelE/ParE family toxin [Brevundimonas naejangsanensis]